MFGLPASSASFFVRPRRRKGVIALGGRFLPDAVSGGARRKTILAENRYAFQKDSNRKENLRRSFKATEGPGRKDRTGEIPPEGYCMLSISTNSTPGIAENIW
ncbi:MAG: hypothetical protein C6W56_16030 [Caldibacillus debilis]|nr:MAG: hypothetical protein C6W56_16030 [Caldibacillus debilis]